MYRIFAQLAAALAPTQPAQRTEEIDVDADSSGHSDGMDTETWPDVSDVSDQEDGDVAEEDEDMEAGSGEEEAEVCVTCCAETTIPTDPIAAGCGHERRMCAGCVRRHIHEELRGKGQVTRIPCPMAAGGECGAILEYHDVQRQASPEDFEVLRPAADDACTGGDAGVHLVRRQRLRQRVAAHRHAAVPHRAVPQLPGEDLLHPPLRVARRPDVRAVRRGRAAQRGGGAAAGAGAQRRQAVPAVPARHREERGLRPHDVP
eukprot:EG_transcript_24926